MLLFSGLDYANDPSFGIEGKEGGGEGGGKGTYADVERQKVVEKMAKLQVGAGVAATLYSYAVL